MGSLRTRHQAKRAFWKRLDPHVGVGACESHRLLSRIRLNSTVVYICSVHLGVAKPKRIIASSAQACPGRTFWLIQADEGYTVQFKLDFFRLPCSNQYLKVRNGDDLQSDLIGEYVGGMENKLISLESTGSELLLEFKSEDLSHMDHGLCGGGFLAHAYQKGECEQL